MTKDLTGEILNVLKIEPLRHVPTPAPAKSEGRPVDEEFSSGRQEDEQPLSLSPMPRWSRLPRLSSSRQARENRLDG